MTEFNPVIIAESTTTLKRLSVSEAVMELDLTGARSWCSATPDTAASTWSTAAPTAISAGSIRRVEADALTALDAPWSGEGDGH